MRSLVRLFNVEDNYFIRDMAEVELFIKELRKKSSDKVDKKVTPIKLKRIGEKEYETVALCIPCGCCCTGHCRWNEHEHGYLVEAPFMRRCCLERASMSSPSGPACPLIQRMRYTMFSLLWKQSSTWQRTSKCLCPTIFCLGEGQALYQVNRFLLDFSA